MRKDTGRRISGILAQYRRHSAWRKVVRVLACVVVFCTTYALILPAITLEKKPACGKEEHTHTESCYTQTVSVKKSVPVCTLDSLGLHTHTDACQDESCGYADFAAHKHDGRCYDEDGGLWCPIPEREPHTHDESCFETPEAHVHGEGCYTKEKGELICTESTEPVHTHEDACYAPEKKLVCTLTEGEGHAHGEECLDESGALICTQEETEGHQHSDACYESVLTCTASTEPAHVHTDECYEWSETLTCTESTEPKEPVLTCEKEEILLHEHTQETCFETDEEGNTYLVCDQIQILEHVHGDACFETVEEKVDTEGLTCGLEEHAGAHTHNESCYGENNDLTCTQEESEGHQHTALCHGTWILTCGREEHMHTEACMVEVETEEDWKKTLPQTLRGDWREDLLAVAESQLDYTEAQPDLQLGEDTRRFTRYGAWYGQPDGDWNTLFVMFCLHYAEIPEESFPQDSDSAAWVEKLAGRAEGFEKFQLYDSAEDYTPQPGDLVFLGLDEDEAADRVGIVGKVTAATEETPAGVEVIEGDVSGKVAKQNYPMEGVRILGYGELPEKQEERPLLCGKEEHTHTELCSSPNPEGTDLILTCGKEAHTHTEECYASQPREYRYEDETVSVTVALPAGSQVPESAQLRVTPITPEEQRYALLEQQAQAAAEGELRQLVLYDLSFYTQEGEYLPVEASAAVTITFQQAVLSGEQVEVLHYGEDSAPVALEEVEVQRGENEALSGLSFQTDGFSVFGVMTIQAAGDYVRASNNITLYPGQIFTVDEVYTDDVTASVEGVVQANTTPYENILKTGSNLNLSGDRVNARNAEYTITPAGDKYTAAHSGTDGAPTVYFNMSSGQAGRPSSRDTAEAFSILDKDSAIPPNSTILPGDVIHEGMFAFSADTNPAHCLFFHAGTGTADFQLGFEMKEEQYNRWGCELLLYKYAGDGSSGSAEIPGYVQVTEKSAITASEKYLIVGKVQDEHQSNYGIYRVLYPNLNAANTYEHVAKVSPYKMTLTGQTAGTAAVTAGKQTWNVTVSDQVRLEKGETVSIQLPAGAVVTCADPAIAAAAADANGLATVTGVTEGTTTAAVTVDGQSYTWNITVTRPTSFRLHYGGATVTFHFKDKNGNALIAEAPDLDGQDATKYLLVRDGGDRPGETENQKNIIIPKIDGYLFSGATYGNDPVTFLATNGYVEGDAAVTDPYNFRLYTSPENYHNVEKTVSNVDVDLNYMLPPVDTAVSPSGTVLNLFDYWVTDEREGQVDNRHPDEGINQGHALKFTSNAYENQPINTWTGDRMGVLQEIVADSLGPDGYPMLSGKCQGEGSSTESLAYLFDPEMNGNSRKTYRNVGGLLQVDKDGYYFYDSKVNYAEFDKSANSFTLYQQPAVTHGGIIGQFFPFVPYSSVNKGTAAATDNVDNRLNHFFGMTMTTRFIQQHGGHTRQDGPPMTFSFSGDDDVWIYIDGILVADLGGIHDPADVTIDFAEGTVFISKVGDKEKVIKNFEDIFTGENARKLNGKTLVDNTYHTLNFYYLERGGYASNLHLRYNLVTFPASGITKVDQVGNPIPGVEFELYEADENYTPRRLVCSGPTNSAGEFVFTDSSGLPLHLENLVDSYGSYYVLKEKAPLSGYRWSGADIHLRIVQSRATSGSKDAKNMTSYVMVCENTTQSGAWASPSLQVTAPSQLQLADDNNTLINPATDNGQLFAIVLKYIGPQDENKNLSNFANWTPVYGTASKGYTVVSREEYPDITKAVAEAAQRYPGKQNYFHLSSSGNLQALVEDLPGDIRSYNFMAGNQNIADIQYIVSFYWTDASGKTTRVRDYTDNTAGFQFTRTFGTDIQVPNMVNRIAVQKLDENGVTPLNGATFAMYPVEDATNPSHAHTDDGYYYVCGDVHVFLERDEDGDHHGGARRCSDPIGSWPGGYAVDPSSGSIAVTFGEDTYTISPIQLKTTVDAAHNNYKEDGIAEFERIPSGKYIIREIAAPPGYVENDHLVMVLVTPNAVYANAGIADDGITVSRGPGYLAGNLHYYAARGDIENTLSWIYSQMKVSGVSNSFETVSAGSYEQWSYLTRDAARTGDSGTVSDAPLTAYLQFSPGTENARFSYELNHTDVLKSGVRLPSSNIAVAGRRLTTDTGWSYLEIYQNYDYGLKAKSPHADYADWRLDANGKPDDLSNLFSRSVYVHVRNRRVGSLEITETVIPADPKPSFEIRVKLTDAGDQPLTDRCPYTVYNITRGADGSETRAVATDGEGRPMKGQVTGGTGSFTLRHDQAVVIENIPAGSRYAVSQNIDGFYNTSAVEKVLKENRPGQNAYPEKPFTGENVYGVEGGMYWFEEGGVLDALSKIDYVNTPLPDLEIVKYSSKNPTVLLPGAAFTLCQLDGASQPTKYYVRGNDTTLWSKNPDEATVLTTDAAGKITLHKIPDGSYRLTEIKAPDGYVRPESAVTLTVKNGRFTGGQQGLVQLTSDGTTAISRDNPSKTVYVPNSTGFKLPQTGGVGSDPIRIAGAALCLLAGSLLHITGKKSRREGKPQ